MESKGLIIECEAGWAAPAFERLVPGAHVVGFGSHEDGVEARKAGFEVRDTILVLSPEGARLALLLRKPPEGTVAENVLRYGAGGLNIDGCRVRTNEDFTGLKGFSSMKLNAQRAGESDEDYKARVTGGPEQQAALAKLQNLGRWPSNLLLVHGEGCRMVGTKTVAAPVINRWADGAKPFGGGAGHPYESVGGGTEATPVYECEAGCPVADLDRQSGVTKSAIGRPHVQKSDSATVRFNGKATSTPGVNQHGDSGGASRFFPQLSGRDALYEWLGRLVGITGSQDEG